jgi:hypothetical protein
MPRAAWLVSLALSTWVRHTLTLSSASVNDFSTEFPAIR